MYEENCKDECVSRRPEIEEQVFFCHESTGKLTNVIEQLKIKLEPVLRSSGKGELSENVKEPEFTKLGAELRKIGKEVFINANELENIISRIEL